MRSLARITGGEALGAYGQRSWIPAWRAIWLTPMCCRMKRLSAGRLRDVKKMLVRSGIDAVENLVLADHSCNNDERDLLPAPVRTENPVQGL
jgi:hypothetical protein